MLAVLSAILGRAAAQSSLIIDVNTSQVTLNFFDINRLARPLLDRGALVAVYFVESGGETDFESRLQKSALVEESSIKDAVIAIYASIDPPYSAIRYGETWASLDVDIERILTETLKNNLKEGVFDLAIMRTLEEIAAVIPESEDAVPPRVGIISIMRNQAPPEAENSASAAPTSKSIAIPPPSNAASQPFTQKYPLEICLGIFTVFFAALRIFGAIKFPERK